MGNMIHRSKYICLNLPFKVFSAHSACEHRIDKKMIRVQGVSFVPVRQKKGARHANDVRALPSLNLKKKRLFVV